MRTHTYERLDHQCSGTAEHSSGPELIPARWNYGADVPPDLATRLARFSAFVRLAIDTAMQERGYRNVSTAVREIAATAGVAESTLWIWLEGRSASEPQARKVLAFCDALDIPPERAFRILWPGKQEKVSEPEPVELSGDILKLVRLLRAPPQMVSDERKEFIRSLIMLAVRQGNAGRGDNGDERRRRDVS